MSEWTLRLIILVVGAILLAAIYFLGQPRRNGEGGRATRSRRREPEFDDLPSLHVGDESQDDDQIDFESSQESYAEADDEASRSERKRAAPRIPADYDKVVVLHVAAREGEQLAGSDLVVAAEKAGLSFDSPGVFFRMEESQPEQPPIFSVASMIKPGTFDLRSIETLRTPGVTFIMTLPGPLSALDAWDVMLPTAQRMAELLDAQLLDDERNALGRQGIAHMRDQLRAWDRRQSDADLFGPRQ